jgi:hypothetical protein
MSHAVCCMLQGHCGHAAACEGGAGFACSLLGGAALLQCTPTLQRCSTVVLQRCNAAALQLCNAVSLYAITQQHAFATRDRPSATVLLQLCMQKRKLPAIVVSAVSCMLRFACCMLRVAMYVVPLLCVPHGYRARSSTTHWRQRTCSSAQTTDSIRQFGC